MTLAELLSMSTRASVGRLPGLPRELEAVETFVVAFSGGKDSVACVLHLLDLGVPKKRIELWHYLMDDPASPMMDWPCTEDYCRQFANTLGLRIVFAGKVGGFETEMLRENAPAGAVFYDLLDAAGRVIGRRVLPSRGFPLVTKLLFPLPVANLQIRWCSAALKIEVGDRVMNNDPRFRSGTFCVVTGIRSEESAQRAKQNGLETEVSTKRTVHRWLAVHNWPEQRVWEALERHRIRPHPAYALGFGRVSCMACIFGNKAQWATVQALAPGQFEKIANYEDLFGSISPERRPREKPTNGAIHMSGKRIRDLVRGITDFLPAGMKRERRQSQSPHYTESIVLSRGETWVLPAGAYKKDGGPI